MEKRIETGITNLDNFLKEGFKKEDIKINFVPLRSGKSLFLAFPKQEITINLEQKGCPINRMLTLLKENKIDVNGKIKANNRTESNRNS